MKYILFFALFFCTIALSINWWLHPSQKEKHIVLKTIDTIVEVMTEKQFDLQGNLTTTIKTPYAYHDPATAQSYYQKPHLYSYKAKEKPWQLTADLSETTPDQKTVYFKNHVKVFQEKSNTHPQTVIQTHYLKYDTQKKIASTSDPITLQQANNKIKSKGAFINFKTHLVKLLSKTEAFYD